MSPICGEDELEDQSRGGVGDEGFKRRIWATTVLQQVCDSPLPTAHTVALAPGHPADWM